LLVRKNPMKRKSKKVRTRGWRVKVPPSNHLTLEKKTSIRGGVVTKKTRRRKAEGTDKIHWN